MNKTGTPSGLRDLTGSTARRKKELQAKIEAIFTNAGYQPISTPDIEFYQTYMTAFANPKDEEMYKFFDQDGQILVLRADMTIPIARVTASKYRDVKPPFRFCYSENVYKVRQSFAGKRNEVTDCGIELIGEDSQSDPEVLKLADDVLASLDLGPYTLEIGNSRFFRLAAEQCNLSMEQTKELADLIDRKSMVELQSFTEDFPSEQKQFFRTLPLLSGTETCLEEALTLCFSPELRQEVVRIKELGQMMERLGCHISYDLSKLPHMGYYTGIIFEGFIPGIGTSILSGGRYDTLLRKFGRDLPACGFGIKLDTLTELCHETKPPMRTLCYPKGQIEAALQRVKELRRDGPCALEAADIETMEVIQ